MTAVEYGLLALFVSVVIVSAAGLAGQHLKQVFGLTGGLTAKGQSGFH